MFSYIKGTLEKKLADSMVVDVGGVGFRIFTAATPLFLGKEAGKEVKVFTHMSVREDNISLYGFLNEEELRMFEQLISVSGIGPKAALSLISTVPAAQFGLAVLTEDADRFTKAPGIGKKTAQRIILELKDKLKKEQADIPDFKGPGSQSTADGRDNRLSEAVSALVMLGYSSSEANRAAVNVFAEGKSVEDIIRDALKNML